MERKNLCAQIPITLHQRVAQGKEASDCQTLGDYITEVLTAYYDYIEHKGESSMNGTKTLAFQISEELFQRIKDHLSYESSRTGKKLTQQQLVNMWKKFADNYPIISLEDGMAETDWEGWAMLTKAIGDRVQLLGMVCAGRHKCIFFVAR